MAEPQFFPKGTEQTPAQKKAAKVQAIKESMAGITKVKQEEAQVAQKQVGALQGAFEGAKGATKLGVQSQLTQQLAQQEGMGAGYNKAAARQAAATAGIQGGMAVGNLGIQQAKDVGGAELQAVGAKAEAAGQLYEQLTGEQKLEKEVEEGAKAKAVNLTTEIENAYNKTSGGGGNDDEEAAISNLAALYETYKDDFANNPAQAKLLAERIAGIANDAYIDYEDLIANPTIKTILDAAGYTDADKVEAVADFDY